jgi:hypothetical protein
MYYSEKCAIGTTSFATVCTMTNLLYMRKGYFADSCRARLLPTFKYWAVANTVIIGMLLKPLTKEEIAQQWRKRKVMGKYLYTLYHMQSPEEIAAEEAANALAKAEKAAATEEA